MTSKIIDGCGVVLIVASMLVVIVKLAMHGHAKNMHGQAQNQPTKSQHFTVLEQGSLNGKSFAIFRFNDGSCVFYYHGDMVVIPELK